MGLGARQPAVLVHPGDKSASASCLPGLAPSTQLHHPLRLAAGSVVLLRLNRTLIRPWGFLLASSTAPSRRRLSAVPPLPCPAADHPSLVRLPRMLISLGLAIVPSPRRRPLVCEADPTYPHTHARLHKDHKRWWVGWLPGGYRMPRRSWPIIQKVAKKLDPGCGFLCGKNVYGSNLIGEKLHCANVFVILERCTPCFAQSNICGNAALRLVA